MNKRAAESESDERAASESESEDKAATESESEEEVRLSDSEEEDVQEVQIPKVKGWLHKSSTNIRNEFSAAKKHLASFLHTHAEVLALLDKWPLKLDQNQPARLPEPVDFHNTQPKGIVGGTMKDYQIKGIEFLRDMFNSGAGCILGDEMGLGKTLQIIAHITKLKEDGFGGPSLIVCPLGVLINWQNEIKKWAPSLRVLMYHGANSIPQTQISAADHPFDCMITTYQTMVENQGWLKFAAWRLLVLDEGHAIKNEKTRASHVACSIQASQRIILTGTPLQNDLAELYALLRFILPEIFHSEHIRAMFEAAFNRSTHFRDEEFIQRASSALKILMIRRLKENLTELSIPLLSEVDVFLPVSPAQRAIYKALLLRLDDDTLHELLAGDDNAADSDRAAIARLTSGATTLVSSKEIVHLLTQLKKTCNHPYILNPELSLGDCNNDDFINCSSKLLALDRLLPYLKKKEHRPLLFSQSTKMLSLLERYCSYRGHSYVRLDGSTSQAKREFVMARCEFAFTYSPDNHPDSNVFVFLISTRAGGLGLNLQTSDTVIFHESDWNPQADIQAMARAHRIGQRKPVTVYRLTIQGTVEERILQVARQKLVLSISVNGSDPFASRQKMTGLQASVVRFGVNQFVSHKVDRFKRFFELGAEEMIENARAGIVDENLTEEVQEFITPAQPKTLRNFEGENHKFTKVVKKEKVVLGKRVKQDRVIEIDGFPVLISTIQEEYSEDEESYSAKNRLKEARKAWVHQNFCACCKGKPDPTRLFEYCTDCPHVFHYGCIGVSRNKTISAMTCPQHRCCHEEVDKITGHVSSRCLSTASAAGGVLFRCADCPRAFCFDHLEKIGNWFEYQEDVSEQMKAAGFYPRPSVCFIKCATCRNPDIPKPVSYKGILNLCQGQLREPPAYWEERTARHVSAIEAGLTAPNFRAKEVKVVKQVETKKRKKVQRKKSPEPVVDQSCE